MDKIILVEPSREYAEDLWAFRQEIIDADADNEDQFSGCMSLNSSKNAGFVLPSVEKAMPRKCYAWTS
jgi:hypothetical protein